MEYRIYTIFDYAAEVAGPPFVAVNDAVASRQFKMLLKDVLDVSDYKLWLLGTYNDETMIIRIPDDFEPIEVLMEVKNEGRK